MSQTLPERQSRQTPARWEPLSELEQATERMRRMLDRMFGGAEWMPFGEAGGWTPMVDIEEMDDAYAIEADLPGVKRDDVDIEYTGNELAITGEIKEKERTGVLRRQTRRTGRFDYRVVLPDQIDPDRIDAKLNDGVLTVRVPKSERSSRRKIEVTG